LEVVQSIATIHRALDLAISLLDTAGMYCVGRNEELDVDVIPGRHMRRVQACLAHGRGVRAGVYPALAAGGDNI
jgi:aryl-alcohol dehydrogenase-like predicted oxidoreductase